MSTSSITTSKRSGRNDDDPILEERLRIANYVLPEDNLEDLIQLPIAPELFSRKVRAQLKAPKPLLPPQQPLSRSDSSGSPSEDEQHAHLPHTPSPFSPLQQLTQEKTQIKQQQQQPQPQEIQVDSDLIPKSNFNSSLPRSKKKPNHINITDSPLKPPAKLIPNPLQSPSFKPSISPNFPSQATPTNSTHPKRPKPPQARSVSSPRSSQRTRTLSSSNNYPNTISTSTAKSYHKSSTPIKASTSKGPSATNPQVLKLRGRSLSTNSIHDDLLSPQSQTQQPPWTTDPSPRIYRIDPNQQKNLVSDDGSSTFQPPSHDDLILPTVARQIEKQSKLQINPTENATFSSMTSNFAQWESLGPQLLIRKASLKQIDAQDPLQNPLRPTPSDQNNLSSSTGQDETEDLSASLDGRSRRTEEELEGVRSGRNSSIIRNGSTMRRSGGSNSGYTTNGSIERTKSIRRSEEESHGNFNRESQQQQQEGGGGGGATSSNPYHVSIHLRGPTDDPSHYHPQDLLHFPPTTTTAPPIQNDLENNLDPQNDQNQPSSACCNCLIV